MAASTRAAAGATDPSGRAASVAATPSPAARLCTQCGLCCDGSLVADVELRGEREATRLEILGLEVEEEGDGFVLLQPCRGLQGRRCAVYADRPECCRTFECRLLAAVGRGTLGVEDALAEVHEARVLLGRVERLLGPPRPGEPPMPLRERAQDALATRAPGARAADRRRRLEAALRDVERKIHRTFF